MGGGQLGGRARGHVGGVDGDVRELGVEPDPADHRERFVDVRQARAALAQSSAIPRIAEQLGVDVQRHVCRPFRLQRLEDDTHQGSRDVLPARLRPHVEVAQVPLRAALAPCEREPDRLVPVFGDHRDVRLDDPVAFASEYQNEPLPEDLGGEEWFLPPAKLAEKTNGLERGLVPLWATQVTGMIDVQQRLLYWLVAAFGDGFRGAVIDYGTWPDQHTDYFSYREASKTLRRAYPGTGVDGSLVAGLKDLFEHLFSRDWAVEGGGARRIDKCAIDTGYKSDLIHETCRSSPWSGLLLPSKGDGIGPEQKPFSEYAKKPGDQVGSYWRIVKLTRQASRLLHIDTNFWKTDVHQRLATAAGDKGHLSLFGRVPHRLLSEHLTAEYPTKTTGRGRTVYVFNEKPGKPDNHLLDCLVGAAALASVQGVSSGFTAAVPKRARKTLAELQAEAGGRR